MADFDFEGLEAYLAGHELQVVVAARDKPGAAWRTRRLEVVGDLKSDLRRIVESGIQRIRRRDPVPYVEGWVPEPHTFSVTGRDQAAGPLLDALLGAYSAPFQRDTRPTELEGEGEEATGADADASLNGRVLGLVSRTNANGDTPQQELVIIRAQNPVIEMAPGKITAIIRGKRLEAERRLFAYDGQIDVLIWNHQVIVLSPVLFENLLPDPERLAQDLAAAVADFEGTGLVAGMEVLKGVAENDSNFARGVRRIHKAGYLGTLRIEGIRDAVAEWGHDTIAISAAGKVEFNKDTRWDFLRLIDDGYLSSELTGFRYEVSSKRRWNRVEVTGVERNAKGDLVALSGPGRWSPRKKAQVLADVEAKRAIYFLAQGLAQPVLVRVRHLPDPTLWAGPDAGVNLLDAM